MVSPTLTVVCASDEEAKRDRTASAISSNGHEVVRADSAAAVAEELDGEVDCVVTTESVTDGDGFDVAAAVRERVPNCAVVMFTDAEPSEIRPDRTDLVLDYVSQSGPRARDRLVRLVEQAAVSGYQVAYPVPEDERARLEAIRRYDLPDSAATDAFDRLTKLVTSHFDIDVAFVGLVDEHEERFVACEGANWETLSREDSICTHTILEREVMVVEDVRTDPRFADNDRLVELGIRSYAGVRLTNEDGHALGALCCTHGEPRSYSEQERRDLRLFGAEAMELLELRRRLRAETGSSQDGSEETPARDP